MMINAKSLLLAATLLASAPMAAFGQTAAAPAAGDSPERTTAQFQDWGMQCVPRPAAAGQTAPAGGKLCEILQIVQNQQQQAISVLAIGRAQRSDPLKLVARLPVAVMVNTPARIVFEGSEAALSLPFRHCLPQPPSCYAEFELKDEALLRRLRARTPEQTARLEWRDPAGGQQGVPVSFRGFGAALEAMTKEGS